MKILIAEDDFTSRMVLSEILKKIGHETIECENGIEAWEKYQLPDAPRMIILDWMMPGMDGPELVRLIRSIKTDFPPFILMLTTKSDKEDIVQCLELGADDYLSKPFDLGELRARVQVGQRMLEMQDALANKIEELNNALEHIKTLRGILPICANCKKIRDDKGAWNQMEAYVRDHTEAQFSHGICPECFKQLYPEIYSTMHPDQTQYND